MQPRNLVLAAGACEPAGAEVVDPDDGEPAEPHAASSNVALATPIVMIDFLNCYLLDEGSQALPQRPPVP
jgi:hypothetical protein